MKRKYFVTLEFPAPDNCNHGDFDWVTVEAETREKAEEKARQAVMRRIRINRIEIIS